MAQDYEVDPYMQPLFDLLGANPKPPQVPLPRPRPGTEPITPEQSDRQNLSISDSMRRLGAKIDPKAWEAMLAGSPDSPNVEDRRNQTPGQMKAGLRSIYADTIAGMDPQTRAQFELELEDAFGPDNPPEVSPRGPK